MTDVKFEPPKPGLSDDELKELFLLAVEWHASQRIVLAIAELIEWRERWRRYQAWA